MASTETNGAKSEIKIWVNPMNGKLGPNNRSYTRQYEESLAELSAYHLATIDIRLANGELELPDTDDSPEQARLSLAYALATKDITVNRLIGGYGISFMRHGNPVDHRLLDYHGVAIHYITDREVPLGQSVLEDDVNLNEVISQLRGLTD